MELRVAQSDMGKVIGRQGKIAKALRTLVRAFSQKENKKVNIEIKERGCAYEVHSKWKVSKHSK